MIRIVADSTCDLTQEELKTLNVTAIPLSIHFGEESYLDGVTIDKNTFYEKLIQAEKLPTTSQGNPADILDIITPYLEQGDEVIGIFLSSQLSGTFQSATIAASMADSEHFHPIDSLSATIGSALLVRIACRLRDEGRSAAEIVEEIEELKSRVRIIAVVDSLKYLQMGGRVSAAAAMMGNLLGINPLISVIDGAVIPIGKARGKKSAYRHLLTLFKEEQPDLAYPIYFAHSHSPETLKELQDVILPTLAHPAEVFELEIGPTIGTHVGPGAGGLAYIYR